MRRLLPILAAGFLGPAAGCSKSTPPPSVQPAPAPANPASPAETPPPVIGEVKPASPIGEAVPVKPTEQPRVKPIKPVEPEPAKPAPTAPEPAEPEPTKPEPTEPEPTKPEPTEPERVDPPADDESATRGIKMYDIQLSEAALTNEIVNRLPAERRDTWVIGQDSSLLIWMEFDNKLEELTLESVWKKDGQEKWRFPFQVGKSPNWRTWVTKRIGKRDAGSWTVTIVDEGGFIYHTANFTIAAE